MKPDMIFTFRPLPINLIPSDVKGKVTMLSFKSAIFSDNLFNLKDDLRCKFKLCDFSDNESSLSKLFSY